MRNTATRQILAGILVYFTAATQVFGQAALLPNAEQQYFDNSGHPLASGTVDYFVPGTTTRKTTWQNSGQTVNNTNPVNLDIGGKSIAYGQGSYRQVVKDSLGNVIWDQPTTAYGASQPSGATGTDTAPVGSIIPYSGFVVPTNWQLAAGQALSRTTFAALMTAITIQATGISCTNTSTTLTGFVDTSIIRVGAPIEATCLPTSTTVASITNATTIVVSQAAAATSTVTATIFPWGNGDQVTTFNVPDLRGRAPVGADCMNFVAHGSTCAGNLTATYYGSNPGAGGQTGGSQSKNIGIANINAFTPTGTISTITPSGSVSVTSSSSGIVAATGQNSSGAAGGANVQLIPPVSISSITSTGTLTGTPVTPTFTGNSLGSGTAFSVVNPDATINYIIKVAPNSTGAGGVVSFGGMFGDIVCDSTLTCAPIGSVNTVRCTPATTSQLGCVQPDGVTTSIVGGKLTAIAGVASSIGIGSTSITGGTNGDILSVSGGNLGQVATTGSGSVVLATSPTLVTPILGAATATSINGNIFSGGPYTLTGNSGKTLTFNNTLTLAGIDSTTLTFQGTDTYVGRATTDTLTNKTLNCANNTCTVRLGSDVTGNLPLTNLATGSLDQVIGYFGATSGNAIAINNCSNALTYSTSTHTFGCNSSAGTGTVTSVTCNGVTITSSGTCPPSYGFQNCSLAASVASNILTVALKDNAGNDPSASSPCNMWFRNVTAATGSWTQVTQTSALSITTNATGASLGSANNTAFRVWVVAFNNGGTPVLALFNAINSTSLSCSPINETLVQSSTAISGSATSAGVYYTPNGTTLSSKAIKILGYVEYNSTGLATAGTYATAPNFVQTFGPGVKRPCEPVQTAPAFNTTTDTGTSSTTFVANTNQQASITLTSAANIVQVEMWGSVQINVQSAQCDVGISRGTTSNSGLFGLFGTAFNTTGGQSAWPMYLKGWDQPNTTSSQAYAGQRRTTSSTCLFPSTQGASSTNKGQILITEIMG